MTSSSSTAPLACPAVRCARPFVDELLAGRAPRIESCRVCLKKCGKDFCIVTQARGGPARRHRAWSRLRGLVGDQSARHPHGARAHGAPGAGVRRGHSGDSPEGTGMTRVAITGLGTVNPCGIGVEQTVGEHRGRPLGNPDVHALRRVGVLDAVRRLRRRVRPQGPPGPQGAAPDEPLHPVRGHGRRRGDRRRRSGHRRRPRRRPHRRDRRFRRRRARTDGAAVRHHEDAGPGPSEPLHGPDDDHRPGRGTDLDPPRARRASTTRRSRRAPPAPTRSARRSRPSGPAGPSRSSPAASTAGITPVGLAGFCAARALSTRNDDPAGASRPFDLGRDGFVIAEGGGVAVLEDWDRAVGARRAHLRRGARLRGHGGRVPHHRAGARRQRRPARHGDGRRADRAWTSRRSATSTRTGPRRRRATSPRAGAIRGVFGDDAPLVSSTKSMTGHLLGGAGALESVLCVKTVETGVLPPDDQPHRPRPGLRHPDRGERRRREADRGRDEQLVRLRRP